MIKIRKYTRKKANGEVYSLWGYDFFDDNGQRHRKTNCQTQGQAQRELKEALEKLTKGGKVRENKALFFKDISDHFLEYHAKPRCKKTTYDWYKKYINKHLLPYFEGYRAMNIDRQLINKFLAEKKEEERIVTKTITITVFNEQKKKNENKKIKVAEKKKYGVETINHCLVTLKAIFSFVVEEQMLSKNPAIGIDKFKHEEKQEMKILNYDECCLLLNTAKDHFPDFYPMLYIAIFTGMREGEILGLCWDKIDIDNKKIKVHRSVYEGEMREFTKTSTSHRTVDMTNSLAELFKELKRKRQLLSKLVFPNDVGKPKLASNMLRRRFHPCLKKAFGDEKIKFHELRHSYVSFLLAQGVPMKYIQHQVGHSTINITMNTYGHLLEDVHENAVQVLDSISDKMKSEKQSKVNLP